MTTAPAFYQFGSEGDSDDPYQYCQRALRRTNDCVVPWVCCVLETTTHAREDVPKDVGNYKGDENNGKNLKCPAVLGEEGANSFHTATKPVSLVNRSTRPEKGAR